jgi:hypothetical protein
MSRSRTDSGGRSTTVSGGVSDDRGAVVLDATVVVFADDPGKWGPHSRFIASARPDQQNRFSIRALPPGRYVAIAVGYLEPGEERDPDLLEAWRQGATTFTLSEGETHAPRSEALHVLSAYGSKGGVRIPPRCATSRTGRQYVHPIDETTPTSLVSAAGFGGRLS